MSKIQVQWMIRNNSGKILGPYSTEAVLRLISEGALSGGELISKAPGGAWSKISKEPQFYDKLIEALEGVVDVDPNRHKLMEAETVITQIKKEEGGETKPTKLTDIFNPLDHFTKGEKTIKPKDENSKIDVSIVNTQNSYSATGNTINKKQSDKKVIKPPPISQVADEFEVPKAQNLPKTPPQDVLELNDVSRLKSEAIKKRAPLPILLAAIILIIAVFLLSEDEEISDSKIKLLMPSIGVKTNLSDEEAGKALYVGMSSFHKDVFESYIEAQNQLVSLVEGKPQFERARGYLCLTYKQLWPFARQDADDIKVLTYLSQSTRAINPAGFNGFVCESVRLLALGRHSEALGVVDQAFDAVDAREKDAQGILWFLKGELQSYDPKLSKEATLELDYSIQQKPDWILPRYILATLFKKRDLHKEASEILTTIVNANPKHKAARISLGIISYKDYRQVNEAFTHLSAALASESRVEKSIEALGHMTMAEILSEKGDRAKALEQAEAAYHLLPTNSEARQLVVRLGGSDELAENLKQNNELLYLGDQYQRSGDCLSAQAEYIAAFEIDPKNGVAALKAARCLWELNQSQEAINWLTKAMRADSKLILAYTTQADYLSQRFNYAGADNVLRSARSIAPNSAEVFKAYANLEFLRSNISASMEYAQKALKGNENDVETIILLSKIYTAKGEFRDAFRFAVKAIELDSTGTEAQINYANVIAKDQGVDSGIVYLNNEIKKYQHTLKYQEALANLYKNEERHREARSIYEKIVEVDPKYKKALMGFAETQQALGEFDKALKSYFQAAVLDPTDAEPLYRASLVYLETGKYDEAIRQLKRVLNVNELFPRTHYFIGKSYYFLDNHVEAMEELSKEKQLNPNLADPYLLAAEIYFKQSQYGKCASEYQQALKLRPQGTDIYVKMARCYRLSASLDIAEAMLNVAASKESGYADIYKEQGAIFEVRGDMNAAASAYKLYLKLSPNAMDRDEIKARCEKIARSSCVED
jgi:tetratricopeptide (TPR) repeat protein